MRILALALTAIGIAGSLAAAPALGAEAKASAATLKRGEYLVHIMDCGGCHTTGALLGQPDPAKFLAGSNVGFQIPNLGIFYPPNLTPDPETGLGKWSATDIVKAVRTGERPDGRMLIPVMPYHSYSKLTDADAAALAAYLKNMKPIANQPPAMVGANGKAVAPYMTVQMPQ